MRVYTDSLCLSHNPPHEILSGKPVPYLESPTRISKIKDTLRKRGNFELVESADPDINAHRFILSVHSRDYVQYLETAYDRWIENGGDKVRSPLHRKLDTV
jgi:acetoin utilization deacetylase AcuC-like enzyme